jgi:hypothetical protein
VELEGVSAQPLPAFYSWVYYDVASIDGLQQTQDDTEATGDSDSQSEGAQSIHDSGDLSTTKGRDSIAVSLPAIKKENAGPEEEVELEPTTPVTISDETYRGT